MKQPVEIGINCKPWFAGLNIQDSTLNQQIVIPRKGKQQKVTCEYEYMRPGFQVFENTFL